MQIMDLETIEKTIQTFAECDMNVLKASKMLFIHRNAMEYRLKMIKDKTGLDPKNFYDLVELVNGIK